MPKAIDGGSWAEHLALELKALSEGDGEAEVIASRVVERERLGVRGGTTEAAAEQQRGDEDRNRPRKGGHRK